MNLPGINDPCAYYAGDDAPSLAWEMTICQCLARADSPYQGALRVPRRFGEVVAEFLCRRAGLRRDWAVVEVGGGYGTLMEALLDVVPLRDVTMVDVSPFFLGRQRAALAGHTQVSFVETDALDFLRALGREVDLVISNENVGDLPTYTDVPREEVRARLRWPLDARDPGADIVSRVAEKVACYGLDLSGAPDRFAFNIGAIEYLEALSSKARAVFLTEHGCDTVVPEPYDDIVAAEPSNGFPRRIALRGHDEYSIRFDHLERVARCLGYTVHRFHLMELLDLRDDGGIRFMVRTASLHSEKAQVIQELYQHVAQYQGLLLTRRDAPPEPADAGSEVEVR